MRVSINEEWAFKNGNYIFTSDGRQVNPKDPDGAIIESILHRQHQDRIDNIKQSQKVAAINPDVAKKLEKLKIR